jgi:hypothetical protein
MPSALTLHVVTPVTGVNPPHAPALAAARELTSVPARAG